MAKHVKLVGLIYVVWGALNVLLGIALLVLGFGAAALMTTADGESAGVAAGLTAATLWILAGLVMVWGGATVWVGAALQRLKQWARLFALALAVLNLFLLPFGTALGVYSLWVLLNDQARQLFETAPAG